MEKRSGPMLLPLCSLPNGVAHAPPMNKTRKHRNQANIRARKHQCADGFSLPEPAGLYHRLFLDERIAPQAEWRANISLQPTRYALAPLALARG